MKYQKIKGKKHWVYEDRDEYQSFYPTHYSGSPPEVKPWKESEEGDWVEADDGGIVQILKRGEMSHPKNTKNYKYGDGYVRTVVGTFRVGETATMDTDFSQHPNRYSLGKKTVEEARAERFGNKRENPTSLEREFVAYILAGTPVKEAYDKAFGSTSNGKINARALLKEKRILNLMNRNIDEIAEKLGLDFEWIMTRLMELAGAADMDSVKLGAIKELGTMLGTKEKEKRVVQGTFELNSPFSGKELMAIEAEKVETLKDGEHINEASE